MATTTEIQTLYVAYFNRPADPLGLQSWLATGKSVAEIAAGFSASEEYTLTYAGKTPLDLVNSIYLNLFGRPAEEAGLLYWAGKLTAGTETFASIALTIANSAQEADLVAINNKVAAATLFTTDIDSTSDLLGYDGAAANAVVKAWLAGITTDASFTAGTTTAAMQAIADAAAVAHSGAVNVPKTFTLTTGVDALVNYTGGAGADIFNAAPIGGVAAFGALDSLDGGAGVDTLNVIDTTAAGTAYALSTVATVKNIEIINVTAVNNTVTANTTGFSGVTNTNVISAGGAAVTVSATTAVTVNDTNLGAGTITTIGGTDVTVTSAGATTGGTGISVTGATGNVVINAGNVNAVGAGNNSGALTTVTGGKTINVTKTATNSDLTNKVFTQGAVNVTGDATTTSVTVSESTKVAAIGAVAGVAAVKEVFTASIAAGAQTAGSTIIFDGVTYTVAGGGTANAAATAAAFVTAYNAVGAATWVAVDNGTGTVTFTKKTAVAVNNVVNGDFTGTIVTTAAAPTTDGVTAVTAVTGVGGIDNGTVTIADLNGSSATLANTIASVSLTGYGVSSTVKSSALTSLTLANSSYDVTVTDAGTTAKAALALTVSGLKAGATLNDATIATLNVTATGAASNLAFNGAALRTVNVAGDKALTLGAIAGVTAFTSTNTAGVTTTLNTTSTGSFGAGADVVTIGAGATKAITLGAGNDTAIITTLATTGTVDGGAGIDTLSMGATAAATASGSNVFAGQVTGFESLTLTGATNQTVDVAVLGGYTTITTAGGNGLTLSNTTSGATLALTGAGTAYTIGQTNALAGTADVLNISLTSDANTAFASTGVTAANVETIKITVTDTSTTPNGTVADTFTLLGNDAKSITVAGNAHLTLTAASTALTSFDASTFSGSGAGAAATGVSWTSGILTAAATIKGSLTGGDVLDATAATKAVTITEIAGTNTIKGSGTFASTLTGGTGADSIFGGSGNDVIVGGGGADIISGGAGADIITLTGNKAMLVQASGSSGANTATTIQTAELTSTFDIVKGLVAGDQINFGNASIVTGGMTLAGANLAAGAADTLVFASGTYDAAAGTFTYAANGLDTAATYDSSAAGGVTAETIILVGFHVTTAATVAAGIITLG